MRKKYQAFSACINSISRSGAEEPGNEATLLQHQSSLSHSQTPWLQNRIFATPLSSYICKVSHPLPSLFLLFRIFGYAVAQLKSFYPFSTFDGAHMRINTRLSPPIQVQCSHLSRSCGEKPGVFSTAVR